MTPWASSWRDMSYKYHSIVENVEHLAVFIQNFSNRCHIAHTRSRDKRHIVLVQSKICFMIILLYDIHVYHRIASYCESTVSTLPGQFLITHFKVWCNLLTFVNWILNFSYDIYEPCFGIVFSVNWVIPFCWGMNYFNGRFYRMSVYTWRTIDHRN